jgi:hypothetical protein
MAKTINPGDVYRISLPDGQYGYGQLLQLHETYGYLLRILDRITGKETTLEELKHVGDLFPPVFVNLPPALKSGSWQFIGRLSIPAYTFPTFRSSAAYAPGVYENWWLWDGGEPRFIGKLPVELRSLEVEVLWGHEILAERIATGFNSWDAIV